MAAGVGEGDMTGSDSGSRDAGGKLWLSFKGMAWRSGCWRGWQRRGTDGEHGTDCKSTVTMLELKNKITARKLQQTARVPVRVPPRFPVRVPVRAPNESLHEPPHESPRESPCEFPNEPPHQSTCYNENET